MRTLCKKAGTRIPFDQRLIDKIEAFRELQGVGESKTTYVELQFLLNNSKIKEGALFVLLKELYGDRFELVNQGWNKQLSNEKVLDDVFSMKRKLIEEQWIVENMNKKHLSEKEEKFNEYLGRVSKKQQMRGRLKLLKDELSILENNMNMAKKDEEFLPIKQKYDKLKRQYVFLSNKKRRINKFTHEKEAVLREGSLDQGKINEISRLVEERSNQKERRRFVEVLTSKKYKRSNSQDIVPIPQTAQARIKILESIFNRYGKKQSIDEMLFGEMKGAQNKISLQNFLKIVASSNIDSLLTVDERVAIFKESSHFQKKLQFTDFVTALQKLCQKNCQKLKVEYTTQILDAFLDEFIYNVKTSMQGIIHSSGARKQVKRGSSLEQKELSRYQFRLAAHSGKFEDSIKDELAERKELKKQKLKALKQRSSTLDYAQASNSQVRSIKDNQSYLDKKPAILGFKRRQNYDLPAVKTDIGEKRTLIPRHSLKQNYASIFDNRRILQAKSKRYSTESSALNCEENTSNLFNHQTINSDVFYQGMKNQATPSESPIKSIDYELRELIADQQDDPFLTSHLDKKNILANYDASSRKYKKIHF